MNRMLKVTRLHLNKLGTYVTMPLFILAIVMVVSVIIQTALQRSASIDVTAGDYADTARWNQSIMWALPGFLIYYGVQAVATTYPFALALGATRRNFVLGTMVANALQSAYIALLMLALLGLELATGYWFMGMHVVDVYVMGAGDPLKLLATAFLGALFCLTVGGVFGAVWVRFGSKGPTILGASIALIMALTLLLVAPKLGDIFVAITGARVALVAIALMVLCLVGTWFAMRRASVR